MSIVLFGQMNEYIQADYAPTNRASCKSCKTKIEKDSLRIGRCINDDHFSGKNWYHLKCFTLQPRFKDIKPETQIYKIDELEQADYDEVVRHIEEEVDKLNGGKKKSKSKPKGKKKGKSDEQKQQEKDKQKEENKAQIVVKAKSKNKRGASSAKKTKKKAVQSGYNAAQKAEFQQLLNKFMGYTSDKLKSILAANNQSRTGNKPQLAQKCADGQLLGKIPNCPQCGGGKLRFDRKTGIYKCPGYMDDDQFKNCYKIYTMSEIVRDPWKQQ